MYRKEFYLYHEGRSHNAVIRNYNEKDFDALITIQRECFPPPFPPDLLWNEVQLTNHVTLFSEGALCVEVDGVVAGSMTGLIVTFDPNHADHTWEEITDSGYIRNHEPDGNTLYVVDIGVRPAYRHLKLGAALMQSMYDCVVHLNLDRLLGGGRMPGYHRYMDSLSPEQYIERVVAGEMKDPVISFLLKCGRTPLALVKNYLDDEESGDNGMLMEWRNPFKNHQTIWG
ncbi:GNAT family N-acetyltransferase [Fictibacillus aquaticus]|uniref:GNAT family N-acetyltransferase n=1 Tax=Fictibacillus aquaticus TaxID=2021314 RepID=A0A235FEC0_9BACL|nr:GNAT family N-acetyltransferase [Fictibacillus aquaticus]OYD59284.1 GNAT family N-acetyltransferase [Fictibacillus aquaticus]